MRHGNGCTSVKQHLENLKVVPDGVEDEGGGVQPILTVPYRGGEGGQKSGKLPYVIYERPLIQFLP